METINRCPNCKHAFCVAPCGVPAPEPFPALARREYIYRHRGGRLTRASDGRTHVLAVTGRGEAGAVLYGMACGATVDTFELYMAIDAEPDRATCEACAKIVASGHYLTLRDTAPRRFR